MLNDEQIARINAEIARLEGVRETNQNIVDMNTYVDGRQDALKWALENL